VPFVRATFDRNFTDCQPVPATGAIEVRASRLPLPDHSVAERGVAAFQASGL